MNCALSNWCFLFRYDRGETIGWLKQPWTVTAVAIVQSFMSKMSSVLSFHSISPPIYNTYTQYDEVVMCKEFF